MNFICSSSDVGQEYHYLERHQSRNGWNIYLDEGWSKTVDYFFKGFRTSWCKIYFDPIIRIESNKLRDFPIYYNDDTVSNFQKCGKIVPVDGTIQIDKNIKVSHQDNFYPKITREHQTFKECFDLLYDAVIENVGTFASTNKRKVMMPKQGGIDTLTCRSVFDYLNVDYEVFDLPYSAPSMSKVSNALAENHWGFKQINEYNDSVVVTGFYGDEWVLRNPYYAHVVLSSRGVSITDTFDNIDKCYMKEYFEHYRNKCSAQSVLSTGKLMVDGYTEEQIEILRTESTEKLIVQICNDFQIWHVNQTYFFSPLKHISLLTLLSADTETLLGQVTDAKLSKAIIEKCNPKLLDLIDPLKNKDDPVWFP